MNGGMALHKSLQLEALSKRHAEAILAWKRPYPSLLDGALCFRVVHNHTLRG